MPLNLEYGFYFTINQITGYSILNDPLNIIGMMILLVAMIFGIYVLHIIFRDYRRTESLNTLFFYIAGVFMLLGAISITIAKFCFSTFGLLDLGNILTNFAWCVVVVGMLFYDVFAFRNTFPEKVKILIIIAITISIFFIGVFIFAIFSGPPYANLNPNDFEYTYLPLILLLIICSFVPLSMLGPLTFFYYAAKTREEDRPKSNLSICFGIGIVFIIVGLLNEIGFIYIFEVRVVLRVFTVAYVYVFYLIFAKPNWFKQKIGWTD